MSNKKMYQNTYEELKHVNYKNPYRYFHSIRIPMRNWNLNQPPADISIPVVSEYLWGIETG